MPGSPPTNTTDPGTMPPPKTKSNSRRPVCHRRTPAPSPRADRRTGGLPDGDRKSTRLNSSHGYISYAVFCLKKKKKPPSPGPALDEVSELRSTDAAYA